MVGSSRAVSKANPAPGSHSETFGELSDGGLVTWVSQQGLIIILQHCKYMTIFSAVVCAISGSILVQRGDSVDEPLPECSLWVSTFWFAYLCFVMTRTAESSTFHLRVSAVHVL